MNRVVAIERASASNLRSVRQKTIKDDRNRALAKELLEGLDSEEVTGVAAELRFLAGIIDGTCEGMPILVSREDLRHALELAADSLTDPLRGTIAAGIRQIANAMEEAT